MIEVEGIVLNTISYGETSKIINVFTKDGIIGMIAKGAKTLKSSLRSTTDKLTYGIFQIYYKQDKLSTLVSVDVTNNFKNIKKSIEKISYASYLLELSSQVYKQNNQKQIYNILIDSLIKLDEGYNPMAVMNIVELKYLDFLGVMPVIDCCSKCGSNISIATLSSAAGGYVCNKCLTNEPIVSEKTIKIIRMFYYVDLSKISKLDLSKDVIREINQFLDEYYDTYTGLYLKSKKFIKNLQKL